ncbi:MAG: trypsin-like peptidase domain-containing protein [Deltaproteobacteria bacterium]|nr:trypsin-like peptidase domain-containing protein [Deltaproteobacteria bacterium]
MRLHPRVLLSVAPLLIACADGDAPESPELREEPLIYGADDRLDYWQLTDPARVQLADATAMLVSSADLAPVAGGMWQVDVSQSFADWFDLCPSEPYADQPAPGWCTGFRVGPNLIATAGHCIGSSGECAQTSFVFGFRMDDASTVRSVVPNDDVYRCAAIVARAETSTDDWAIIRVDRPIVGAKPTLPVRRFGKVGNGAPLVLAGYPGGLPLKVAAGATVRTNSHNNFFETNVDAYGGNSGSPVVDAATGVVEGILVRGNSDFDYVASQGCYVSNECPDTGCPGWEDASRTTRFAGWIPCAASAECSDGNACTVDVCDGASRCSNTPLACAAGTRCVEGACVACQPRGATCTASAQCCSGSCNTKKKKCN